MSMTLATPLQPDAEPIGQLNMTPLIDVMLVLIIMLIVTIPRANHAIRLDLPQPGTQQAAAPPDNVFVDFDGSVLWNGALLPDRASLEQRLAATAALGEQAQLQVRANPLAPYDAVAGVLASAQRHHIRNLAIAGQQ